MTKGYLNDLELYSDSSLKTVVAKFCGEYLGKGSYRMVYVLKSYPDFVIKIETDLKEKSFSNIVEYKNWVSSTYTPLSAWLAPCEWISCNGRLLVQRKVIHGTSKDYPTKIPSIFTDLKLSNYGFINGKFVSCDYASLLQEYKHKKISWWNENKEDAKD